jgi:hypothetical protein
VQFKDGIAEGLGLSEQISYRINYRSNVVAPQVVRHDCIHYGLPDRRSHDPYAIGDRHGFQKVSGAGGRRRPARHGTSERLRRHFTIRVDA